MRGRRQWHVERTVHGDAVVEVHRIPHPTERTLTDTFDPPGEVEHATWRDRPAALAAHQRFVSGIVVLARTDRDLLAPVLVVAAGHVTDEHGDIVVEHGDDLLGKVDLGVIRRGVRSTGLDHERVLHVVPHVGGDLTGRLVVGDAQHQLLVGPHRAPGLVAEVSVDRTWPEAQVGEALLHLRHVVAGHSLGERTRQLGLHHRGRRLDHLDRRHRGQQRERHRVDACRRCRVLAVATAERDACNDHDREDACCGDSGHPLAGFGREGRTVVHGDGAEQWRRPIFSRRGVSAARTARLAMLAGPVAAARRWVSVPLDDRLDGLQVAPKLQHLTQDRGDHRH